jgi:uncharacterized damage-inducible protein DinB
METIREAAAANDPRYPIGDFVCPAVVTVAERAALIDDIRQLPARLADALAGITTDELETPYRDGGWTIRATVHHLADSHINSICRFKLAVTEDEPTIKPYFEDRWADLADYNLPIDVSLAILNGVHARFTALLESFTDAEFARTLIHPDNGRFTVAQFLALYAWHGRHHTAHVAQARERYKLSV